MDEINEIVNEIYDPKIEDPEYQTLMASCIKAWIRNGIERGIQLGKEDCALEIEKTIQKYMNPKAAIVVIGKKI